ncbi:MAG TPA: thiamine phosphate synthase [Anaeromyxobacteraceae bacterium]|nr:thiamine phosphate synthase [Anaeromyxobacteraceae bacterium]
MPLPESPDRRRRLERLRGLYAIVGDEDPVGSAAAVLDGGASVVQVRLKTTPTGAFLLAAREVVDLARGRALVIVNDRADLAFLAGADGVHLGDEDLPPGDARRLLGDGMLVGRTCRTLAEARAALDQGADHVGFGPMFASASKALVVPPRGVPMLREVAEALPAPVVAIGGITLATIGEVAAAGAAAAAVIHDLFARGEARERARLLAGAFAASAPPPSSRPAAPRRGGP